MPLDEVLREFHSTLDTPNGDCHEAMTAKEKLRVRVEELTEQEAEATLDFIASRGRDDFARWLDSRPEDDEPLTAEEREALTALPLLPRRPAVGDGGNPTTAVRPQRLDAAEVAGRGVQPNSGMSLCLVPVRD